MQKVNHSPAEDSKKAGIAIELLPGWADEFAIDMDKVLVAEALMYLKFRRSGFKPEAIIEILKYSA